MDEDMQPKTTRYTVGDLKKAIKDLPDEMTIITVGCDCTGVCTGIFIKDNELYMDR